ncbi:MAG: alpha/beta fold hydrolase [Ilumatobacter sp.]|uniref:alpha/beta hydrolase family protein n=2 Tax=Ilumatobacter sp. TaxID=1967498 RepID=UPI0032980355
MTRGIGPRMVATAVAVAIVAVACGGSDTTERTEPGGAMRIEYGDHPDAFGDLWLPDPSDAGSPAPVVVLIHGGFWRDGFFLDLMDPLIPSLLERGVAVWNIEYRRVGAGGGHPETFEDVASAVDHLARMSDDVAGSLDLARIAVVGHSAGGHLAAWAAGRSSLAAGAVGADPVVRPVLAVSQAGVLDLVGCAEQGVGGAACVDLVGVRPSADPERYDTTSPTEMVPFDAMVVAVHGELDRIVPPSQSVTFVERATAAGMDATYLPIPDADHFSNLDPRHPAWIAVLGSLAENL